MAAIRSMDLNPHDVGEVLEELTKLHKSGDLRGLMFAAKLLRQKDIVYDCAGSLSDNGSATGAAFSLAVHLATKSK